MISLIKQVVVIVLVVVGTVIALQAAIVAIYGIVLGVCASIDWFSARRSEANVVSGPAEAA